MLIIAGHVQVDPERRDEYVAAHVKLVGRARSAPGCLDLAITADLLDPGRVNNFERWESQEALDAWRKVARAPRTRIEFLAVDVQLYDVTGARPPF